MEATTEVQSTWANIPQQLGISDFTETNIYFKYYANIRIFLFLLQLRSDLRSRAIQQKSSLPSHTSHCKLVSPHRLMFGLPSLDSDFFNFSKTYFTSLAYYSYYFCYFTFCEFLTRSPKAMGHWMWEKLIYWALNYNLVYLNEKINHLTK